MSSTIHLRETEETPQRDALDFTTPGISTSKGIAVTGPSMNTRISAITGPPGVNGSLAACLGFIADVL